MIFNLKEIFSGLTRDKAAGKPPFVCPGQPMVVYGPVGRLRNFRSIISVLMSALNFSLSVPALELRRGINACAWLPPLQICMSILYELGIRLAISTTGARCSSIAIYDIGE